MILKKKALLDRRQVLLSIGATFASSSVLAALGCAPDGEGREPVGGWATGGTAAMTGGYPDPFTQGLGSACTLSASGTAGPCHALTVERQDISEGVAGLPVRLSFQIVNAACAPVPGATLELWHTAPNGLYSGPEAIDFCTGGDAAARASRWFRGIQTADANGRIDFDSCFPGWYPGRAIHIHFTVRANGTQFVTSQVFFDEGLATEILTTQPEYSARGAADTPNARDGIFRSIDEGAMQWAQRPDGVLHAWKTLVIAA